MAKTCAMWVWTVRRDTKSRSPIWGLVSPSAASRATVSSAGVRLCQPNLGRRRGFLLPLRIPAERRAASTRAMLRLRPKLFVRRQRLVEVCTALDRVPQAEERDAQVLSGAGELEDAGPVGVGLDGCLKRFNATLDQPSAPQRRAGQ